MFRRAPGPTGFRGGQLGLWEFQTAGEATELMHGRNEEPDSEKNRPAADVDWRRQVLSFARPSARGWK